MATQSNKSIYAEKVASSLIEKIQAGTAPWQTPFKERLMPHNGHSGHVYQGGNAVWLACQDRKDPRWFTFVQAKQHEYKIIKGEKATLISTFRPMEKERELPDGTKEKVLIPAFSQAYVFNAEQMTGVPALKMSDKTFVVSAVGDDLIKKSGANIEYVDRMAAGYSVAKDTIFLSHKDAFKNEAEYYSTALHELSHWTGHPDRLDRFKSDEHGTPEYAREELRAEIGSMLICMQTKVPFTPENSAAYVKSWVKALRDNPDEIFQAARDADKIRGFVMGEYTIEKKNPEIVHVKEEPQEKKQVREDRGMDLGR